MIERVALLGLGVQRARAGEGERLALRLEGPLVGRQQRVGAGDRRVQLHHVTAVGLLPVADVLAGELDVEVLVGQFDLEGRHRRAGDDVIDHAAAVGDAFADGEQMQRVGLDGLRQPFDAQGGLPGRVAQPEGGLDAGDFAREEGGGDFRQALRALGGQAKARVRRHARRGRARIWL